MGKNRFRVEIEPGVGVNGLSFGMSRASVHEALGPPPRSLVNHEGEVEELWEYLSVIYGAGTDKVVDFTVGDASEVCLIYRGAPTRWGRPLMKRLLQDDAQPVQDVGFILFRQLSLAVEVQQRGIVLSSPGRWERFAEDFEPVDLSSLLDENG